MNQTKLAIYVLLFAFIYACQNGAETITIPLELMEEQRSFLQEATIALAKTIDIKERTIKTDWQGGRFPFFINTLFPEYEKIVLYYDSIEIDFRTLSNKLYETKNALTLNDITEFEQSFYKNRDTIIQKYQRLISNRILGLREDEVEHIVSRLRDKFRFVHEPREQLLLQDTSFYRYHLNHLDFQIITFRLKFMQEITAFGFSEGRFQIVEHYPLAHLNNCYIEQGDSTMLTVGLGNFMEVPVGHFTLFVDKDTVTMDNYYGQYLLDTSKKGSHQVTLTAKIYNPLTGEIFPRESSYSYEVH